MKLCILLCEGLEGIIAPEKPHYATLFTSLFQRACTEPIDWEIVDVCTAPEAMRWNLKIRPSTQCP